MLILRCQNVHKSLFLREQIAQNGPKNVKIGKIGNLGGFKTVQKWTVFERFFEKIGRFLPVLGDFFRLLGVFFTC